jgi:hypothetical protein
METLGQPTREPSVGSPTSLLLKWMKNDIFQAIQTVGLDPKEFDLEDDGDEARIKHKWSASCFTVDRKAGNYAARYVVGDGPEWPTDASSWQASASRISTWLAEVKRDLETPDLWAELQREAKLLGANADDVAENTPFTPDEQKEIAVRLRALAEHARRTYSLSAAQMRALDAKLGYLVDAARRLGRKDWLNVCAGAILGYILTALLPPEAARDMFLGLLRAIGHLYGLPDLPMLST